MYPNLYTVYLSFSLCLSASSSPFHHSHPITVFQNQFICLSPIISLCILWDFNLLLLLFYILLTSSLLPSFNIFHHYFFPTIFLCSVSYFLIYFALFHALPLMFFLTFLLLVTKLPRHLHAWTALPLCMYSCVRLRTDTENSVTYALGIVWFT
jgi:hypothetical protein